MWRVLFSGLLLLLVSSAALASETLIWWAATQEQADALRSALDELWPSAPILVVVGPFPQDFDGLGLSADGLEMRDGELWRNRPGAMSPRAAVLLARSWSLPLNTPEAPPPEAPPPVNVDAAAVEKRPSGWSATAGPARRMPVYTPGLHFCGQWLFARGQASFELDTAERVILYDLYDRRDGGLMVRRLGVLLGPQWFWTVRPGWALEGSASLGIRTHVVSTVERPDVFDVDWTPTGAARLRLWGPGAAAGAARVGGGVMVSYDGLAWRQQHREGSGVRRPLTLAVEVGFLQKH